MILGAVGPSAGRMDHRISVGIDSDGITDGNFHVYFSLLNIGSGSEPAERNVIFNPPGNRWTDMRTKSLSP